MKMKKKRFFLLIIAAVFVCVLSDLYLYSESGSMTPKLLKISVPFHENGKLVLFGNLERKEMEKIAESEESGETEADDEKKGVDGEKIRVLLKNQGFTSFYHEKLQMTSSTPFIVCRNGKKTKYDAGEKVAIQWSSQMKEKDSIEIFSTKKGRIKVLSFKRMDRYPSYRGKLLIKKEKRGLLLINELLLEEYLYAVVSSEISSSDPIEALKAQAVCARTYAVNKRKASEYEKYGADIDDSDACQVYNNIPEDKNTRRAVRETADLILKKDGKRIPVYYFSTSWGYTASGKEVWNTEEQIPYLQRKFQITEQCEHMAGKKISPDLSEEKAFSLFLDKNMYVEKTTGKRYSFETYDSSSPWFRWQIRIPWVLLDRKIGEKIKACYEAYPNLVFFQDSSGGFSHGNYREIGALRRIYPGKRDISGLVTELIVEGSKNTVMIRTQYSIRRLLCLPDEEILLMDGTSHAALRLLPSAAFYAEKHGNGEKAYLLIKGGGFGHGTGMSQWGAKVQAESGWSFRKILKHYFAGITIGH